MLLLREADAGRRAGRWSLIASALLTPLEIGWRLVPTNTDPTYRWALVAGYWVYAMAAWRVLAPVNQSSERLSR